MKSQKKKCKHCRCMYIPDPRNRDRQNYCSKTKCRTASKAASQEKWKHKPENQNYFKGQVNVRRVQRWRKKNPGYSKKKSANPAIALQDPLIVQPAETKDNNDQFNAKALQDLISIQPAVFIGLIAQITGASLQDDIAETLNRMQHLGRDILTFQPDNGGIHDCKTRHCTDKGAQGP